MEERDINKFKYLKKNDDNRKRRLVYIADLEMKNSADEVFTEETVRGEGGFGSTNKNDAVEVKAEASVVNTTTVDTPAKKRGRPKKQ